jgi:hypothetical protein
MGSAIFIPTAQAVFQNELLKALKVFVPQINPLEVLAAGANAQGVHSFPPNMISGILQSYVRALKYTFAVGVPLAGVALLVSPFMPWFKYHNESQKKDSSEAEKAEKPEKPSLEGAGEEKSSMNEQTEVKRLSSGDREEQEQSGQAE